MPAAARTAEHAPSNVRTRRRADAAFARAGSGDHLEVGAVGSLIFKILDAVRARATPSPCCHHTKTPLQRCADRPVGNDVTESRGAWTAAFRGAESEPTGIREMNGADRSGVARDRVPDPPRPSKIRRLALPRAKAALVEARLGRGIRRDTFDEQRPHARAREAEGHARV